LHELALPHFNVRARFFHNPYNLVPTAGGVSLERLLWIAFCRVPIEQCFQRSKQELGMDHFEVRSWLGIHRHFYITQLSFLFCSGIHHKLGEKNDKQFLSDGRASSFGRLYLDRSTGSAVF
jgi:SRSO17 transposase